MEAGLRAMAAAGSLMVGSLQGGRREVTRFEPARDSSGAMTDPAAFDDYLGRVRAEGAATTLILEPLCCLIPHACSKSEPLANLSTSSLSTQMAFHMVQHSW